MPKKKSTSSPSSATAELAKRSRQLAHKERELQDWETSLAERQALYDGAGSNAEQRLKVLEAKIESKESDLALLDSRLAKRQAEVSSEVKRLDRNAEEARERKETVDSMYMSAKEAQELLEKRQKSTEERLESLNQEIEGRKKYQKEQEELIDKAAGEANMQLNKLNRDVHNFEQEREDMLGKIHADTLKLTNLESKINGAGEDLTRLEIRYKDASREYRTKLTEVKLEIAEAEDTRDKALSETSQLMLDLKAERAEMDVAREVVTKQREEVFAEKRKLESLRTVYGMN